MTDAQPRILIIDNDEGVLTALWTRLSHAGYRCTSAGTGAQGLAAFCEERFDLVITDLVMPAGDGLTLARSIRERSDVPIIVVTGFHTEYKRELRLIPNVTLLEKPFETNRLLELVEAELLTRSVSEVKGAERSNE